MSLVSDEKLQIIALLVSIFAGFSTLATTWRLAGRQQDTQAKLSGKYSKASVDLEERGGGGDPRAGEPDS